MNNHASDVPYQPQTAAPGSPRGKFDPPNPPPARGRRRLAGCAIVLLALLVVAALLPYMLPTAALRDFVVKKVKEATGRECALDSLSFGWLEGVRLEGFRLGAEGDPLRVELARATADASWLPLLRKRIANLDVRVAGLCARYRDSASGLDLDWTVSEFRLAAPDLDEAASFAATLHPGADPKANGRILIEGKASLVRRMAYYPEGWAKANVVLERLDMAVVAGQVGQGGALAGGSLAGEVAVDFNGGRVAATPAGLAAAGVALPADVPGGAPRDLPTTSLDGGRAIYDLSTGIVTLDQLAFAAAEALRAVLDGRIQLNETNAPGLPIGRIDVNGRVEVAPLLRVLVDAGFLPPLPVDASGGINFSGRVEMPREADDPAHPLKAALTGKSGELRIAGGDLPGEARIEAAEAGVDIQLGPALASLEATIPLAPLSPTLFLADGSGQAIARFMGEARVSGEFADLTATVAPGGSEIIAAGLPDGIPEIRAQIDSGARMAYRLSADELTVEKFGLSLFREREQVHAFRVAVPRMAGSFGANTRLETPAGAPIRIDGSLEALSALLPPAVLDKASFRGAFDLTLLAAMDGDLLQLSLGEGSGVRDLAYRDSDAAPEPIGTVALSGKVIYNGKDGVFTAEPVMLTSLPLAAQTYVSGRMEPFSLEAKYGARFEPKHARRLLEWLEIPADLLESATAQGVASYRDGAVAFRQTAVAGRLAPPDLPAQEFSLRHDLDFLWDADGQKLVIPAGAPLAAAIDEGRTLRLEMKPGEVALTPDGAWHGLMEASVAGRIASARPYVLALARLAGGGQPLQAELAKSDLETVFEASASVTPNQAKVRVQSFAARVKNAGGGEVALVQAQPVELTLAIPGAGAAAPTPEGSAQVAARADLAALREWGRGLLTAVPPDWLGLDPAERGELLSLLNGYDVRGTFNAQVGAQWVAGEQKFNAVIDWANAEVRESNGGQWQTLLKDPRVAVRTSGSFQPAAEGGGRLTLANILAQVVGADPTRQTAWLQTPESSLAAVNLSPFRVEPFKLAFTLADVSKLAALSPAYVPADLLLSGGATGEVVIEGALSALKFSQGVLRPANLVYRTGPTAQDLAVMLPQNTQIDWQATLNLDVPPEQIPAHNGPYASLAALDATDARFRIEQALVAAGADRWTFRDIQAPAQLKGGVLDFGALTARADPPTAAADGAAPDGAAPTLELSLHADFRPELPQSRVEFKAQRLPVAALVAGFLPNFAQVHTGIVSMPPPEIALPVTAQFTGLDGDSIAKTIRIEQAAFRVDNFSATAQARGQGKGDGLLGMLGLANLPEALDGVFGVRNGALTLSLKSVQGTVNADGAGNVNLIQPIVIEGDRTADYMIAGKLTANAVPADSTLDFTAYVTRNMDKLINVGELTAKGLETIGQAAVLGVDRDQIAAGLRDALEKEAQAHKIAMPIRGTLGAPTVGKGIAEFIWTIVTDSLKNLALSAGKEAVIREAGRLLEGSDAGKNILNILGGQSSTTADPNAPTAPAQKAEDLVRGALDQFRQPQTPSPAPTDPANPAAQPAQPSSIQNRLGQILAPTQPTQPAPAQPAPTQPAQPAPTEQPAQQPSIQNRLSQILAPSQPTQPAQPAQPAPAQPTPTAQPAQPSPAPQPAPSSTIQKLGQFLAPRQPAQSP